MEALKSQVKGRFELEWDRNAASDMKLGHQNLVVVSVLFIKTALSPR